MSYIRYLAHDIEEDNEDLKYEILPWVLGPYWRNNISHFLQKKDDIWARMNYRAIVSKKCCEEVIIIQSLLVYINLDWVLQVFT